MKKTINYLMALLILGFGICSCGISKEIRTASKSLVEKQKTSLESHETFHKTVIETIDSYLIAELNKSQKLYDNSIKDFHKSMLQELKKIYSNAALSDAEKKVAEEEMRYIILGLSVKAEKNYLERNKNINEALELLNTSSDLILKAERAKSLAIEKINEYLQTERPSEKLLGLINIDLENYTKYIGDANEAIKQADNYLNKLK